VATSTTSAVVVKGGVVEKTVTVAMAADDRYLPKLLAVVEKLRAMKHGKSYRIIAYDLGGVSETTKAHIRCASPTLIDELRDFDFSAYPSHVQALNCYAWKPLILASLYREFSTQGLVCLDSGLTLAGPAHLSHQGMFLESAVETAVTNGGVVSDKTARDLLDFTHHGMFEYFDKTFSKKKTFFTEANPPVFNCNGAFSAWAPKSLNLPNGVAAMDMWEKCALDKKCICPDGSNRGNHRQDQAALTLALAAHDFRCYTDREKGDGVRGPDGKGTAWVHAHGLRMNSVHCQDADCFVKQHASHCVA
jgi:hypothetical protein